MKYFFGLWDSVEDFVREGQEGLRMDINGNYTGVVEYNSPNSYSENYIRSEAQWFEIDPNLPIFDQADISRITQFVNQPAINEYKNVKDEVINKIDLGGITEKDRLKATDDATGIFSFGLAAPTLYRLVEWYIYDLDKLADMDFGSVEQVNNEFYYRENPTANNLNPKQYSCRRQQKGTYDILKNVAGAKLIEVSPNFYAATPTIGYGIDGTKYALKFGTRNKKIYLKRPKIGGAPQYVDIFVTAGGLGDLDSDGMTAKVAPIIMLAQQLEQSGAKVRIYGLRAYQESINDDIIYYSWVAKEYGAPIDLNRILLSTADPRFYRITIWQSVEGITRKRFKKNVRGAGRTIYSPEELSRGFNMYRNYLMRQKDIGFLKSKVANKNLIITGGLPKPKNYWNDDTKEAIEEEFYRISDLAELVLSNQSEKSIKRMIKRDRERNQSDTEIKNRLQRVIDDAFYTTLQKDRAGAGIYADSLEYVAEMNDKKQKLEDILNRNLP